MTDTLHNAAKPAHPVAIQADALLAQCDELVGSLPDDTFCATSERLAGGTIGKHLRHCLDHYRALLCDEVAGGAVVDYDHRDRDVAEETDRTVAQREIAGVRERIAGLGEDAMAGPVRIRVMLSAAGDEAELGTTLGRELAFATHHAIHHCAMMKSIAGEFGATPPAGFGTAPSTLNHEANQASQANRGSDKA